MSNSSLFGLNLVLLLFLLIPGYLGLRGYLNASIQLDTTSRIDKLLLGVLGGLISLIIVLVLNRFGILSLAVEYWYAIWGDHTVTEEIGFDSTNAVFINSISTFNALTIFGFIFLQSIIAYVSGYLYGTVVHIRSKQPQRSDKDLEQPWETALRQSALGDRITVITKNGTEVEGELYRMGSPSEDYDILLSAAEKVTDNDRTPLGVTYHHYQDVSQVQFPQIKPLQPSEEGNAILRAYKYLRQLGSRLSKGLHIKYHRFSNISHLLRYGSSHAKILKERIENSDSDDN